MTGFGVPASRIRPPHPVFESSRSRSPCNEDEMGLRIKAVEAGSDRARRFARGGWRLATKSGGLAVVGAALWVSDAHEKGHPRMRMA